MKNLIFKNNVNALRKTPSPPRKMVLRNKLRKISEKNKKKCILSIKKSKQAISIIHYQFL